MKKYICNGCLNNEHEKTPCILEITEGDTPLACPYNFGGNIDDDESHWVVMPDDTIVHEDAYYERKADSGKLRYDLLNEIPIISCPDSILLTLEPNDNLDMNLLHRCLSNIMVTLGGRDNFNRELARIYTYGAIKYGDETWKTVPDAKKRYTAALFRHLDSFRRGEYVNEEDGGVLHLAQVAWNIISIKYLIQKEK